MFLSHILLFHFLQLDLDLFYIFNVSISLFDDMEYNYNSVLVSLYANFNYMSGLNQFQLMNFLPIEAHIFLFLCIAGNFC